MHKNKFILLFGILTIQLFGCNQNATLSDSEKELVIAEVRAMLHDYHQSMNDGGLLTEFDFEEEQGQPDSYQDSYLKTLFRRIISINAP